MSAEQEIIERLGKWDYHIDKIRRSKITQEKKERAFQAFDAIRNFLGDDWLPNAANERHKIVWYWFVSFSPELTSEWLTDFTIKLQALQSVKGFNDLLGRIRNSEEYPSAEAEFELASRMRMRGFELELGPKANSDRKADIRAKTKKGGSVYFEIKSLRIPEDEITSREIMRWGYSLAGKLGVAIQGKVHKKLSEPHKNELKEKIEAAAKIAKETGKPQEVIEERVMTALVIPELVQNNEYAQAWLSQQNLQIGFHGPDFDPAEKEQRIRRAFKDASEQLPKDEAGIMVVYPHRLIQLYQSDDLVAIADPFEEEMYSHSNVVAGVLIDSYLFTGPNMRDEMITVSNHILLKQIFFNAVHENSLIVKNRFSRYQSTVEHPEEFFKR
jgi:hypothetical protein